MCRRNAISLRMSSLVLIADDTSIAHKLLIFKFIAWPTWVIYEKFNRFSTQSSFSNTTAVRDTSNLLLYIYETSVRQQSRETVKVHGNNDV